MKNVKKSVGFTGTQIGMSDSQKHQFKKIISQMLVENKIESYHHGDCIGADEDSHNIINQFGNINIIIHPPIIENKRAFCKNAFLIHPPKPYLDRNHDIVNSSNLLIATPKEKEMQLRSGTWATIRYAKKKEIPTIIIYPDGIIEIHNKNVDKYKKWIKILA